MSPTYVCTVAIVPIIFITNFQFISHFNKKAVLLPGNRAMQQLLFEFKVYQ